MARLAKFVDIPISGDQDLILPERLIGITITNQGTNDIKVSMGSQNAVKIVRSDGDVSYGDLNGGNDITYITGNLKIVCEAESANPTQWSSSTNIVLTFCYDVTGTSDQEQC